MRKSSLEGIAILVCLAALVAGLGYMQFRIVQDCGWYAIFKGSEWLWMFGACHQ